ncbi:MAG: AsmA-like C-terminal region-containing protein [Candidatus Acidiferrales bacterium]
MLRKRWFRWAVVLAAVLLIASEGFSLLLRTPALHRYLTARLESSFGRPVEVRTFSFSLLDGPRIEALDVSVAEDPRFGQEYFLRAEQLTAGPRWSALLSGHFEFGTLSFTRPTLNLARMSDGHWNLESWLPAPAPAPAEQGKRSEASPLRSALRFHLSRIEVDGGRVNFKQDQDVRPFALEDVTGDLEQESPGRWQIDFDAEPMRPGVAQPQGGMVHVRGLVGGTSSRLQPADLEVSLSGASIEDALRLTRGDDFGIRGAVAAEFHAHIEPPAPGDAANLSAPAPAEWNLSGTVHLAGIHLWDSPSKPGQPSVNVHLDALWRSGESRLVLTSCDVQAPASVLHASGELLWNHGFHPRISIASSEIAYGDLLAWYRTFHAGVNDDLSIEGWVRAEGAIEDWPPRIVDASLESAGARVVPLATLAPLRFARWNASLESGALSSSVIVVQFEPAPGAPAASQPGQLRIEASLLLPQPAHVVAGGATLSRAAPAAGAGWRFRVSLDGTADRVQDYVALARQFGGPLSPLWRAEGALAFHVRGDGDFHSGSTDWQGSIESHGLSLQFAFLNQPLILPSAVLDLGNGAAEKLTLTAAQGFDTVWAGTVSRTAAHPAWQFDLTTDRLDASVLDRWIEPRSRPAGLLERLGLFGSAQSSTGEEVSSLLANIPLHARGRMRVGDFSLAPLSISQLDADVEIAGKSIEVHRAKGSFAGGTVDGEFAAALGAAPTYDATIRFDRVDLATLVPVVPSLPGMFFGAAAGELTLHASGIGREALLDSLTGQGSLVSRNLQIAGFDFGALRPNQSAAQDQPAFDDVHFTDTQAAFRIADRMVHVAPLRLTAPAVADVVASGTVDFQGSLDLRIEISPTSRGASTRPARTATPAATGAPPLVYRLTGSFASPQIAVTIDQPPATPAPPNSRPARGAIRGGQR